VFLTIYLFYSQIYLCFYHDVWLFTISSIKLINWLIDRLKVDIENCYDSIDQHKLFDIIATSVLSGGGDYVVRRYVSVIETGGRLRRTFHREATSFADFQPSFVRFITDRASQRGAHDAFFVDQVLFICIYHITSLCIA